MLSWAHFRLCPWCSNAVLRAYSKRKGILVVAAHGAVQSGKRKRLQLCAGAGAPWDGLAGVTVGKGRRWSSMPGGRRFARPRVTSMGVTALSEDEMSRRTVIAESRT